MSYIPQNTELPESVQMDSDKSDWIDVHELQKRLDAINGPKEGSSRYARHTWEKVGTQIRFVEPK